MKSFTDNIKSAMPPGMDVNEMVDIQREFLTQWREMVKEHIESDPGSEMAKSGMRKRFSSSGLIHILNNSISLPTSIQPPVNRLNNHKCCDPKQFSQHISGVAVTLV
jgi:hypothetical protein